MQSNPWNPGEIVFCWETGGKAPQRTWTVMADGSGLRPLYPEAPYEWITHEAVITKDEVAVAILYLHAPVFPGSKPQRRSGPPPPPDAPGAPAPRRRRRRQQPGPNAWGPVGDDSHPTGVGIVNLRTREMRIVGQVPVGNPGRSIWHVNGSADGRWAVADDFRFRLWLIDRHTGEMIMLASMGDRPMADGGRPHPSDLQRRRHQNCGANGDAFRKQALPEYLRRPRAPDLAGPELWRPGSPIGKPARGFYLSFAAFPGMIRP